MDNADTPPVTDLTLHALHLLSHSPKPVTLQRLHGIIPQFMAAHLQSAIDRGWALSQAPPRHSKDKGTRYTLTDAGTAHLRRLVEISQSIPAIA